MWLGWAVSLNAALTDNETTSFFCEEQRARLVSESCCENVVVML